MTGRISIPELRARSQQLAADPWIDVLREGPYLKDTAASVLALLDAVEAAHAAASILRCRDGESWSEEEHAAAKATLEALARFDFGEPA